jgi:hypothetical protein
MSSFAEHYNKTLHKGVFDIEYDIYNEHRTKKAILDSQLERTKRLLKEQGAKNIKLTERGR